MRWGSSDLFVPACRAIHPVCRSARMSSLIRAAHVAPGGMECRKVESSPESTSADMSRGAMDTAVGHAGSCARARDMGVFAQTTVKAQCRRPVQEGESRVGQKQRDPTLKLAVSGVVLCTCKWETGNPGGLAGVAQDGCRNRPLPCTSAKKKRLPAAARNGACM